MESRRSRIRWGRVTLAALLSEVIPVAVLVLIVYLSSLFLAGGKAGPPDEARINAFAKQAGNWVGPLVGSLMTFLFSLWAGRKLEDRFVVHGTLIGALVAVIDLAILLVVAEKFEILFVISNVLKIAAGAAGGMVAERLVRQKLRARPAAAAQ